MMDDPHKRGITVAHASHPRGSVYAISNAIVVTDTDDVIDAACRARRMWNDRHPGTVMPEGLLDPVGHAVWFPRPYKYTQMLESRGACASARRQIRNP